MGSQLAFCYPEKDLIFACHADTQRIDPRGRALIHAAVRREIVGGLSASPLPEAPETLRRLREKIASLTVAPMVGARHSPTAARVSGVSYALLPNPMGIGRVRFCFSGDSGTMRYATPRGEKEFAFGIGRLAEGLFPETHYPVERIGAQSGRPLACLASAAWGSPDTLNLFVHITDDCLGSVCVTAAFKGDAIALHMTKQSEWILEEYQGFAGGKAEG